MSIKERIRKLKPLEVCLFIIFAGQLLISIYFNVALLGEHMGYDSSWSYLKASLVWREKALLSNVWTEQTNVFWDSSMPLASLLYGITGNLLVSYGIANTIVLIGLIWCMYGIVKDLQMERSIRLICVNLLICPYLVNDFVLHNDLGYFSCLISGSAFYSVRVLLFLMIVKVIINLQKEKRLYFYMVFSLFLCILTGISTGAFMTIILLFPCIVYFIEIVWIDNKLSALKRPEAIYVYICLLCSLLGKVIGENVLNIATFDSTRTWISIEKIWTNIGSIIQGFMVLLGVLPLFDTEIPIFSREGLYRVFPIFIFVIVVIAFIFCMVNCLKNLKNADRRLLFFCNIVVCNFIIFSLYNCTYGGTESLFEARYLICAYIAMIILVGYFLRRLDKKMIFTLCLEGALILGILGTDVVSDYKYMKTTNDFMQMSEIKEIVETTDAELVYCWGNSLNILERNMRVYDLSRIYKSIADVGGFLHWGDYLYYENNGDYTGPTVMIVDLAGTTIPEDVLNHYSLIGTTDLVNIYYCQDNPIDFSVGE